MTAHHDPSASVRWPTYVVNGSLAVCTGPHAAALAMFDVRAFDVGSGMRGRCPKWRTEN
jgi:hypothetical protein